MVREIHGAKINPKSSLKFRVRKIRGGANYASKYVIYIFFVMKTSLMHYLSLIYFVIPPLHVSGIPTARHQ
jgi:hypothetical protein